MPVPASPRPNRLDAIARLVWTGAATSRRGLVGGLAALLGGGLLPIGNEASALDTEPVADTDPTGACATTAAPAPAPAAVLPAPPRPAAIYAGTCSSLGESAAFDLLPLGVAGTADDATPEAGSDTLGASTAIVGEWSATLVSTALGALLDEPHAIAVLRDDDDAAPIACGDIGGRLAVDASGESLVLGVREVSGSSYSGMAWLRGDADRTLVQLFLASGLASNAAGQNLVITDDGVNVRSSPTTDAAVVGTLQSGTRVTATGAAIAGWVPITDPATGISGYVLEEFLQAA